jgi:hypothetical protein
LEIDDVIANLEASQEKEEESPTTQAVKVAFGRTMGLIKTVGGIVVDGASTVSGNLTPKCQRFRLMENGWTGFCTGRTMLQRG